MWFFTEKPPGLGGFSNGQSRPPKRVLHSDLGGLGSMFRALPRVAEFLSCCALVPLLPAAPIRTHFPHEYYALLLPKRKLFILEGFLRF